MKEELGMISNDPNLSEGMVEATKGHLVLRAHVASSEDALNWFVKNQSAYADRLDNISIHSQPAQFWPEHECEGMGHDATCPTPIESVYVQLQGSLKFLNPTEGGET